MIALDESFGLPGKLTLDGKWHAGPSNKHLVAFGRKPSDRNPTGLQGFHARHLLVIIDECCGLPKELWEAADSLASNQGGTILACGNPTDPTAYMAEVCKPGSGWEVQQIRSTDTPEFTGEEVSDELRGVLASREWVEAKRRQWGETSPAYVARILGEFPDISDDTLIMPKWIEAAITRNLERTRRPKLGADIARYGDDKTTIYRREGGWVRKYWEHDKADTMVNGRRPWPRLHPPAPLGLQRPAQPGPHAERDAGPEDPCRPRRERPVFQALQRRGRRVWVRSGH